MSSQTLARRYAKALLDLATERNEVERIQRNLEAVADAWETSRELREAFSNPSVTHESRTKIIEELSTRILASVTFKNTLLLLSQRQRLGILPDLARAYATLAEQGEGRIRAEVITATALPGTYFEELKKVLEAATGKKVQIHPKQDPSLIGGIVTRIGDKVFDGSLKNKLSQIEDELQNLSN